MAVNTQQPIYIEVAHFLVSQPTLEEIASHNMPSGMQQHVEELLTNNREGVLSTNERLELEKILAISHVMTLVKKKAQLKLAALLKR